MAAAWTVALDPPSVTTGRAQLDLNASNGINVEHAGIDWGEAAIKAFMAEQLYGESPTDYRIPNRVISIPIGLGMTGGAVGEITAEQARRKLQEKVGLLQRQGGVLLRQREGGEPLYADIVNASMVLPDVWGDRGGVEPGVVLKLECLPDFYGEEIELDPVEEEGQIVAVLKQKGQTAIIAGDYPGRARIVLTEKSEQNQRGLLWGFRSTRYDAAATAALAYDAKSLTPLNGAKAEAVVGSYSGECARIATPVKNTWHPILSTDILGSGAMTHVGNYRVLVRCKGEVVGTPQVQLLWSNASAIAPTANPVVVFAGGSEYQILDLGEVRIEEPPAGLHWWRGIIRINTGVEVKAFAIDRVWLQPLDDGAGKLRATATSAASALLVAKEPTKWEARGTGEPWTVTNAEKGPAETTASGISRLLALEKLGFALTEGVVVTGVAVTFEVSGTISGWTANAELLSGGSAVRSVSNISAGPRTITMGGPEDTWGVSPGAAAINSATFGIGLHTTAVGSVKVLKATVTVYWKYAGEAGLTTDAVLYKGETAEFGNQRHTEIRFDGAYRQDLAGTLGYARVSEETGDLARIPPSGIENRPCQLFVKNSRGLLPAVLPPAAENDAGKDKLKAQVFYRPCFLGRL